MRSNQYLLTTLLLASCAAGPDYVAPEAPKTTIYTKEPLTSADALPEDSQHLIPGQEVPADWWTAFHSDALNQLVEQALKNNPDLKSAKASLRQAEANVSAQEASFFPTIQGNFQPTRQKNALDPAPTLTSNQRLFNLYTAQLSATWTPDVFGTNRRAVEALEAQAEFEKYQLEAANLTLTSNLVAAAIQEASLRAQIKTTQEIIRIEREQLEIIRKQFSLDVIPEANVIAQQTALAQAQASLPSLQKQLAQQRDLIAALVGKLPDDQPEQTFTFASLQLPKDLPITLPSKLVEQRPDIKSSEAQLHEATAQVGVAIGNILPSITLSATDGSTATQLSRLFASGTGFWGLIGNASQTLFDAGALIDKKHASDAALDQAAAQYESTVIHAFQNVADSLLALKYDADAVTINRTAEQSAKQTLDIARTQVKLGATSYLTLLTAEQTYQQTLIAYVQAQATQYSDTAILFQALGGGWWNRKEAETK